MKKMLLFFMVLNWCACTVYKTKNESLKIPFDKQGHRGSRGLMPENTIPAMLKAIDQGVTTLEMDVVMTRDNQFILSHEPYFNHQITTKPDGGFVTKEEERDLNIYKMTYAETQAFDVGTKPHPNFARQQKIAVTKPLLSELIDRIEAYVWEKKHPPVHYNIETKTKAATDGIYHPGPEEFVTSLINVLIEKGIASRSIIQSFDVRTLQVLHKKHPAIRTSLLIDQGNNKPFAEQIEQLGFVPSIYSPHLSFVTQELINQCKEKGVALIPWTINDLQKMVEFKKMGVDGIITDYPDLFASLK